MNKLRCRMIATAMLWAANSAAADSQSNAALNNQYDRKRNALEHQAEGAKDDCESNEHASVSSENKGLSIEGRFGVVGGSYMLGGGVTTPWFYQTFRVNVAMHAAFYTGALDSDASASWTSFGYGHARLEIGAPFFRSLPIRPYGFGGLTLVMPASAMSSEGPRLGGLGGLGLEVGILGPRGNAAPVTYGFEFAGIGNSASVVTPAREENLVSGFSASGVIRGYFW